MALQSSGSISLSQVNTELGLSSTAAISLSDAAVRALFAVASGTISLSNGFGKSRAVPAPTPNLQASVAEPYHVEFGFSVTNVPAGCGVVWEATHNGQICGWEHYNYGNSFMIRITCANSCTYTVAMRCYISGNGSTYLNGPWSNWVWKSYDVFCCA